MGVENENAQQGERGEDGVTDIMLERERERDPNIPPHRVWVPKLCLCAYIIL